MKKILAAIIITLLLVPNFILKAEAKNTGYFVVTAYYSPLPNQNFYLTGNYKSEKRLNGQGIRGASGKGVFSGMLAGPKNYKFGTKIYLEGLGVGEISDRGGAIVSAGNRGYRNDRIDVWVGYGDEGLRRALYWGKRTIKGRIINKNNEVTLDYNIISAPKWATTGLKTVPNIFKKGIGKGSNYTNVVKLQTLLKETGLYNGKMDGIYNNTIIDIIYSFQIKNGLIKSGRSYGAGYWGGTTRKLFLKKYLNGDFDKNTSYKKEIINTKKELNIFSGPVNNIDKIKKLQEILNALGYYNGKITGVKKDIIDPIYDFQKSQGIVKYTYSPGAGSYGPKTRSSLEKEYKIYQDKIEKERKEKIKIEEDIRKEQERKDALEKKYEYLKELSIKNATKKINYIGESKFGEVSHRVRDLQNTLKELGYFEFKDTAIYGDKTKDSIIKYQIDNNIISTQDDLGAGIIGPKTKKVLKNDLQNKILKDLVISEKINIKELVVIKKEA